MVCASAPLPQSAAAATPDWPLTDYVHTEWTHHDGLPLSIPEDIDRSADGYLWIVTRDRELLRFDGMRFVPERLGCDDQIGTAAVGRDGTLWAVCGHRLLRRSSRGEVVDVPQQVLQATGSRPRLHVDSRGQVWIFGMNQGNAGYRIEPDGPHVEEIYRAADSRIVAWAEDSEGTIWMSNREHLIRMRDGRFETVPLPEVYSLTRAPDGGIFAGSRSTVWHLRDGTPRVLARTPQGVAFTDFQGTMAATTDGGLWIGTRQHGIALVHEDGRVELLASPGQRGEFVSAVFVDAEDTVWVGTASGLHRFRKPHARVLSSVAASLGGVPQAAFVDSRDVLWASSNSGLIRLPKGTGPLQRLAGGADVVAMAEDKSGRIWVASTSNLGYVAGDRFVWVRDPAGAPIRGVYALQQDSDGELWALAEDVGLYRVTPGPPRLELPVPVAATDFLISSRHGTWIALRNRPRNAVMQHVRGSDPVVHELPTASTIFTLKEDADSIWIGTHRGLLRWRHAAWTMWTKDHGLPGEGSVFEIAADTVGRLWLMTAGGIVAVTRAQLDGTVDGMPRSLTFARIGDLDRVIPHTGGMRPSPRVSADRSGQLYFATVDSVAVVDPAAIAESSLRPHISIESVTADNRTVDLNSTPTPRLVEPSRLQFEYTSLSLRSPENIRFRYKLEGYDADWIEAGAQRRVTYGTLQPGAYRFRVSGSDSSGTWNDEGAVLAFHVAPLWWHTWWFRFTLVGLAAMALIGFHRLRMHRLAQQLNVRFEAQLAERTRIAQDLHDTLLQSSYAAWLQVGLVRDVLTEDVTDASAIERALPSLTRATDVLSSMNTEGRATVGALRTDVAEADLADALRHVAREQHRQDGIDFHLSVEGPAQALQPPAYEEVYRIAREALVNACRHADARRIEVHLVYTAADFRCVVRDDGRGVEAGVLRHGRPGHWGLTGMRERAARIGGELQVRSVVGAGTQVDLRVRGRLAYGAAAPRARFRQWLQRRRTHAPERASDGN